MMWLLTSILLFMFSQNTVPGTVIYDRMFNTASASEKININGSNTESLNRKWVQNFTQASWTSRNGTVYAYSNWDEASRAVGMYKDGDVKGQLAGYLKGPASNFGDITGDDTYTYLTTSISFGGWVVEGCGVMRSNLNGTQAGFAGGVGENNAYFSLRNSGQTCALYRNIAVDNSTNRLYVTDSINNGTNKVIVFQTNPAQVSPIDSFNLTNIRDMVAVGGKLWIIRNGTVGRYSTNGTYENVSIPGILKPTKISISRQNELMIWDDSLCVVHFIKNYNTTPRSRTFGYTGGMYAANKKTLKTQFNVFPPGLTGMNTDTAGNIYLTWGYVFPPFTDIRVFRPNGDSLWRMYSATFVGVAGLDETKDGTEAFTTYYKFKIDWSKPRDNKFSFSNYTVDYRNGITTPIGGSSTVRYVGGRRIILRDVSDLYSNGFTVHIEDGYFLKYATVFTNQYGQDAYYMDSIGNVWDATKLGFVRKYNFVGFRNGLPYWDTINYKRYFKPTDMFITRTIYNHVTDDMIFTGYTSTHPNLTSLDGDKTIGRVIRKYRNYSSHNISLAWQDTLKMDTLQGYGVFPKAAITVKKDYIFIISVGNEPKDMDVYRVSDGTYVGKILPGAEIDGTTLFDGHSHGLIGWIDTPYGITSIYRQNGEYVIVIENDLLANNWVYRWCPTGSCP